MINIKRLLIVIGIVIFGLPMFSQEKSAVPLKDTTTKEQQILRVEKMPVFPGGDVALLRFIAENLEYPAEAIDNGIEGTVIVKFVVGKDGKSKNPEIVRSAHPLLDKAAIDVVLKLPLFTPGEAAGEKVSVYYNLPVRFALPQVEKKIEK